MKRKDQSKMSLQENEKQKTQNVIAKRKQLSQSPRKRDRQPKFNVIHSFPYFYHGYYAGE